MPKLLITSMGGTGSLNLVNTLRGFDTAHEYEVIGTHYNPYELAKSDLKNLYVVPKAKNGPEFVDAHVRLIEKHGVDVLIANSDIEAAVFSANRHRLPCRHLLPPAEQIDAVQDKFGFFDLLRSQGCRTVPNIPIKSRDGVGAAIDKLQLGEDERFWIRLRSGAGSQGATWLHTELQALRWIDLWQELRGVEATDFVLAPFLPGRDFCVSVLFQDGEMCVAKVYERLAYWAEDVSLSMMGSTPKVSRTIDEREPIEATIDAVEAVCRAFDLKPHGLYQADLKCDVAGTPYVTEINIGRFPMTSPQFDRVGKYSQFSLYLQLAMHPSVVLPRGVYDLDPGWVFLRGVDVPLVITRDQRVAEIEGRVA